MFKKVLPSRRTTAADESPFEIVTPAPAAERRDGKENVPQSQGQRPEGSKSWYGSGRASVELKPRDRKKSSAKVTPQLEPQMTGGTTNVAFERMLDDLQIPSTVRVKLTTLETPVKAAMLRSSHVLGTAPAAPKTPPSLRRTRSNESLATPRPSFDLNAAAASNEELSAPRPAFLADELPRRSLDSFDPNASPSRHTRGASLDLPRSTSIADLAISQDVKDSDQSKSKPTKPKGGERDIISPQKFCQILTNTKSVQLELETVKKLRIMLRNEAASWSEDFLRMGGYSALMSRLHELLEMEWREESRDDPLLHEILRCFKALSTSSIGCFALRSSAPTPFVQLVSLLYSDKKPGDIGSRQLVVELLLILFEIYPPPPQTRGQPNSSAPGTLTLAAPPSPPPQYTLPSPHTTLYSLIRALLLTPAPLPSECPSAPVSPHAFIESLRTPRIYKTYLQELSDVCRDYFWVFCHPGNTIWLLAKVDEAKVERPRAPGGMTGGVEYEAMTYLTTHLRLINAISRIAADQQLPSTDEMSAHKFHADLFASGFERILATARKASTAYYPALHLEISRYVQLTLEVRFEVPWTLARMLGNPPAGLMKPNDGRSGSSSRSGTPAGPRPPLPMPNFK
ncbi:diaphanous GTPase-binding domain protein [Rhizoctonia solani 123E]|uniref:Diaphanous GTPase-binding domain protein n=1 Tax=Rhizoctonia solani 123E TaxID=1423351 RepID=A0A074RNX7_9AGAM|nr:diaphanous GTPase-binding domain protein [Rhizoctonia solani 123E]